MEDFQEFPKVLFLGGNPEAEHRVVFSAEEEAEAQGFSVAWEVKQDAPRKPGRPRKSQEDE